MRKTVVITGGNAGIGLATAKRIAQDGARIILACRDTDKAARAKLEILTASPDAEVFFHSLDLSSFDSIRCFASELSKDHDTVDILINNAGVITNGQRFTEDGFELQFGVNYLGHFLLTHLLLPSMVRAESARIIHLSSLRHVFGKINFDSFRGIERYSSSSAYAQSKLANALFSNELARRLPANIFSNAVHPGGVDSEIHRESSSFLHKLIKLVLIPAERSAEYVADMATSDAWQRRTGQFVSAHGILPISRASKNRDLSRRLYEESCKLTAVSGI